MHDLKCIIIDNNHPKLLQRPSWYLLNLNQWKRIKSEPKAKSKSKEPTIIWRKGNKWWENRYCNQKKPAKEDKIISIVSIQLIVKYSNVQKICLLIK